ncbi:glycosyltransferase family 4 protein [Flavobacterium paronense]|uniref:Glycosyltransferase family 4 protein n=1 Tax=Flavobacterium paronense TaxID=1392775 RepID=A0ABV5GAQ2_9FLAO|nr:glycosyltransferase family 4 protein [Flavobacterium paronense]MDN3676701.1 glycosyltransferase family 4 protein [Flavobacterium paronense]
MSNVINKVKSFFNTIRRNKINNFYCYKGFKKVDLLIYDDIFPHPVSGFRYEEFTVLLSNIVNSKIIMTNNAYPIVKTPIKEHKQHLNDFLQFNKQLKNKLKFKKGLVNINAKLFYCVFINNIFANLTWLEKYKIPFIFTLYPGGGFEVDDVASNKKLKKVFGSSMFRKVIVTQQYTKDYLLSNNFCKPEAIEFIFGGVVPQISIQKDITDRKSYLLKKETFDVCFCAAKYTARGEDKGYDVFIEFAHKMAANFEFIRFHIIGGFSENDIDVSLIKDKIQFYGYQKFAELSTIYKTMDVLISPNKPFFLGKGAFDGFPLGTVIEAALNGVVTIISDELKQNSIFVPDEELIIIDNKSSSIEKEVIDLIHNPKKLNLISENGRKKFMKIYSNEIQMKPRIELLRKEIEKYK